MQLTNKITTWKRCLYMTTTGGPHATNVCNKSERTTCNKWMQQKQDNHLESRDAGSSLVKTWTPVHPAEVGLCERNKSQHMIIFNDQNKIIFDQDGVMMRR